MPWARHGMCELALRVSLVVVVPASVVLYEEYADEEVRLFICIDSKEMFLALSLSVVSAVWEYLCRFVKYGRISS